MDFSLVPELAAMVDNIPEPVRKNLFSVLHRLSTTLLDIPLAHLEGYAERVRSSYKTDAQVRERLITKLFEGVEIPAEHQNALLSKHLSKLLDYQINIDKTVKSAFNQLEMSTQTSVNREEAKEIEHDWLDEFENIAKIKSKEDAHVVFGKILANEIKQPGSISIRSMRILAMLNQEVATWFQTMVSCSISTQYNKGNRDTRMLSLGKSASLNGLHKYGLSFYHLNILQEYGLIIPEYNSSLDYADAVFGHPRPRRISFDYKGVESVFVRENSDVEIDTLLLYGISLTYAGKEIADVIERVDVPDYDEDLRLYLQTQGIRIQNIRG